MPLFYVVSDHGLYAFHHISLRYSCRLLNLRLAAAHVARVQAGVADGVLVAQPSKEALETETVAAVGRGAVPDQS